MSVSTVLKKARSLRKNGRHLAILFKGGRIIENGQISPTVAVTVDGRIAAGGLDTPVGPDSEVRLLPALGGG